MTAHAGYGPTSSASSPISDPLAGPRVPGAARPGPSVTVVICVYTERRWPQIVRAVGSVLAQETPAAQVVVVVDHNPALLDQARQSFPGVTVVPSTGPRGLSAARNTGVAAARGEIVAFLDDDAEAEPDWLARLLPHYRDERVLAVGGQAVPAWERERPQWLPPEFDWVVGCSFTGQPTQVSPVRNLIGCNMSFRRAVLERTAGFDTALGRIGRTPAGCEETELCIRIRQQHADAVVLYEPAARVRHRVTADRTTWRYFRRRCYSEGRSKAIVTRLVGKDAGLSAERAYARRALPDGVRRGLRQLGAGDRAGLLRSGAIVAGLLLTAAGYVLGQAMRRLGAAARARSGAAGRPARARSGTAAPARSGATAPARSGTTARARSGTAGTPAYARSGTAGPPTRARRGTGPAPVRVVTAELSEGLPAVPDGGAPDGGRYAAAQILVRLHGQPLGLLDVPLPAGGLDAAELARVIWERLREPINAHRRADGLPPLDRLDPDRLREVEPAGGGLPCPSLRPRPEPPPFVSVIVPTCGRTPLFEVALDSLTALDYPRYEIVVVDNAPELPGTARIVAARAAADPRIRYTREPCRGVTHARNRGLVEAQGEILAFADDDVVVDRRWLRALVDGFTAADVAAVTGQVLARELDAPAQIWIEQYGGYGKGCQRRRFDRTGFETVEAGRVRRVAAQRRSLYPYLPGSYGSGANMAFRAETLRRLGGFDPRLPSGEDIDVLLHLVLAGHAVVYEPGALVWHTHRRELRALRRTMYQYGAGLGAVLAKCVVTDAAARADLLRRLPHGMARALLPRSDKNARKQGGYPASLTVLELCGLVLGPAYFAAATWSARSRRSRG